MFPHVVNVDAEQLARLKALVLAFPDVKALTATNQYEAFRAQYRKELIIGYTSGKVTANGLQSKKLLAELTSSLESVGYELMIGSDEAGKGEWLGPMVISAVALTPKQGGLLRGEGVMDSKDLDNYRISVLSRIIKKNCISFRIILVSP